MGYEVTIGKILEYDKVSVINWLITNMGIKVYLLNGNECDKK